VQTRSAAPHANAICHAPRGAPTTCFDPCHGSRMPRVMAKVKRIFEKQATFLETIQGSTLQNTLTKINTNFTYYT
jgi:hypothetical protein